MDENTENKTVETTETSSETMQETTPQSSGVSFPTMPQSEPKSKKGLIILIISILAILGVLGFFIFKGSTPTETPTPIATVEAEATEMPTATPDETVDKSKVVIEIQNGTGISGEAAFLQGQLRSLGYTNVKVGNASVQDSSSTIVTFSKSASSAVVDEITTKLESLYKNVETKTSSTSSTDVLIVTGLRKGATAKPSSTPTPKATTSGTPKPSGSATPTASASPTATP